MRTETLTGSPIGTRPALEPRARRRQAGWLAAVALLAVVPACAADRELPPADLVCGDGVVALPFEGCDVDSPGCIDCQVDTGWRCDDVGCRTVCGDGVWARPPGDLSPIHPDFLLYEECDDSAPDSEGPCDSSCRVNFKPEACDMNGYWIVRQTDFSLALGFLVQTSSTWYVHHITQTGSGDAGDRGLFAIDESITCGVEVTGSARVTLPAAGELSMMYRNTQDGTLYLDDGGLPLEGEQERPARAGVIERVDAGCRFEMSRHYSVRGVDFSFLPPVFDGGPELDALPPLPARPEGDDITTPPVGVPNLDVDGDGLPGLSWPVVVGALSGTRATIQRNYTDYGPGVVRANASELSVPGAFDVQENVLQVVTGGSPDLLVTTAVPDPDRPSIATFRFLGRSLDEPAVQAVIAGPLEADAADDARTCANAKEALVHVDAADLGL